MGLDTLIQCLASHQLRRLMEIADNEPWHRDALEARAINVYGNSIRQMAEDMFPATVRRANTIDHIAATASTPTDCRRLQDIAQCKSITDVPSLVTWLRSQRLETPGEYERYGAVMVELNRQQPMLGELSPDIGRPTHEIRLTLTALRRRYAQQGGVLYCSDKIHTTHGVADLTAASFCIEYLLSTAIRRQSKRDKGGGGK